MRHTFPLTSKATAVYIPHAMCTIGKSMSDSTMTGSGTTPIPQYLHNEIRETHIKVIIYYHAFTTYHTAPDISIPKK